MREHYEERLAFAKASDDYAGWTDEIVKAFLRDVASGVVAERETRVIAKMLNEASCEAAIQPTLEVAEHLSSSDCEAAQVAA